MTTAEAAFEPIDGQVSSTIVATTLFVTGSSWRLSPRATSHSVSTLRAT